MKDPNICQYLPWDSKFFGFQIGRVNGHRLSKQSISEIEHWCKRFNIDCLYFLADSDHPDTVQLAEDFGFHQMDIRLTLQCDLKDNRGIYSNLNNSRHSIRTANINDITHLKKIARNIYTHTRFFTDPNFNQGKCEALYETWIQKSIEGSADIVWVSVEQDTPCAYVTCHLPNRTHQAEIGLVGVSMQSQGKGIGLTLIQHSLAWFDNEGAETVNIVTQGRNIQAQRLYQSCGFRSHAVQLWYHKWMRK